MADWIASPPQSRRGEGEESNRTGKLLFVNSSSSPQSSPEKERGRRGDHGRFCRNPRVANSIEKIEKALDRIDAWTKKICKELKIDADVTTLVAYVCSLKK